MRFTFSLLFLFALKCFAVAQTQSMLFEKTWSPNYGNGIIYADELPNGDYFLAGRKVLERFGNTMGYPQIYACRINPSGNILWEKDWGNAGYLDQCSKVIKCHDGSYMIIGNGSSGIGGGYCDITASNITEDGDIRFFQYYDFSYKDYSCDVFETPDSCFIITGTRGTTTAYAPVLLKIDFNGNEVWRRIQGTLSQHIPFYMGQTPDGGFVTFGQKENCYYAKYDADGQMQWIKYPFGLGDTIPNYPLVLRTNNDGTFDTFYGTHYYNSSSVQVTRLFKHFDSTGNCLLTRENTQQVVSMFINQADSSFWGITDTDDLAICGANGLFTTVANFSQESITLDKSLFQFIKTSDGGYLAVGQSYPDNDIFSQFYVVKFGANGNYQPAEFSETINAYPNPSNDGNITLTFDMLKDDYVHVDIYTSDGKLIYTNSIFCPSNSHTELPIRLDLHSAGDAMYILQARTSDAVMRKMLVVGTGN
jgi:hypothetical protein